MTRSLLKQEAKKQLSKNFAVLLLSGLLLGIIEYLLPNMLPSVLGVIMLPVQFIDTLVKSTSITDPEAMKNVLIPIVTSSVFITYCTISALLGLAICLIVPVLNLGVHHVYLKATTEEKPHFLEMFSKMSQFGTAFLTSLLSGIFVFLWSLLLIIPGIMAAYSYSMVYFILAEHPEFGALDAIRESKRMMKGHKFELFVLQLSFFWWYLLCGITFGLAIIYVIPYTEMAKANFYNKIKQEA